MNFVWSVILSLGLCRLPQNKSEIVWPYMGQKYLVRHVLRSNLVSFRVDQFCRAERNDCVLNCFVEPALHRREWELRDKNHRLWFCSPQTTRQSAPEDSLLHPAVRSTRDTQIWRLWWILRPVESGGHSGEWKWDDVRVKTNYFLAGLMLNHSLFKLTLLWVALANALFFFFKGNR